MWNIKNNQLLNENKTAFSEISENFSLNESTNGCFLTAFRDEKSHEPQSFWSIALGVTDFEKAIGLERISPWWVKPFFISSMDEIPTKTSWMVLKNNENEFTLLAPLPDFHSGASASLFFENDSLNIRIDTNDPARAVSTTQALFIAKGNDFYKLCTDAMKEIRCNLKTFRLKSEKIVPKFIDYFGWCTWDAFYQTVSEEKVLNALKKWKDSGINLKMMILDDGWLSHREYMNSLILTAFRANDKFHNSLKNIIERSKTDFGIETFLVWHALNGYWGGVDPESFPEYNISLEKRSYNKDFSDQDPKFNEYCWSKISGVVSKKDIYRFIFDFHRFLKQQGVDGVKVDSQASLEGACQGMSGKTKAMLHYREALEGSTAVHFNGNLINCMSNSLDIYYTTSSSSIMRTSPDFFPKDDNSHGTHIITNAYTGIWFGEIGIPDWDMFHSEHIANSFHAAARAMSGSPVYVSDKPDKINTELLKQLVLADGRILRCEDRAKPFPSTLFDDPGKKNNVLKIFNINHCNHIVGVFNCTNDSEPVEYTFSLEEILRKKQATPLALFNYQTKNIKIINSSEFLCGQIPRFGWELFTATHLINGWASIGSTLFFNSGGIIIKEKVQFDSVELQLLPGVEFTAYSQKKPSHCNIDGIQTPFSYKKNILTFKLPTRPIINVKILF